MKPGATRRGIAMIAVLVRDCDEAYGTVAVFGDLYGNRWDLIEPGAGANA